MFSPDLGTRSHALSGAGTAFSRRYRSATFVEASKRGKFEDHNQGSKRAKRRNRDYCVRGKLNRQRNDFPTWLDESTITVAKAE